MGDILYVVRLVISDIELNIFLLGVTSFWVSRHTILITMIVKVHDLSTSQRVLTISEDTLQLQFINRSSSKEY